jgi:acyl-CoA synthetase (AMP-forming)/AMP-acid ligase II
VALAVGNHPRHFFHFLALNRLGASIVPLNPDYRQAELRYALSLTAADLVVCQAERRPLLAQAIEGGDASLCHTPLVELSQLEQGLPEPARTPVRIDDGLAAEAAILFTSGTSGRPKGCVLSNEYVLGAGAWYRDMGGHLSWQVGQDRLINPLPVFHMNCSMVAFPATCLTHNCLIDSLPGCDAAGSVQAASRSLGEAPPHPFWPRCRLRSDPARAVRRAIWFSTGRSLGHDRDGAFLGQPPRSPADPYPRLWSAAGALAGHGGR